jgi:hypothetical protein
MLITRNGLVPVRTAAIRPTNLATRPSENEASEAASVTPQEGLSNTINDPGNADLAITIGSTQPVAGFAALERTLDLIRRFAVVTGWQDAYDLERWQAQSGTEL